MQVILDTETLAPVIGTSGASVVALVAWLVKKGYVQIWITKLTTSLDEITALKNQNGNALTKLNMSDDLVDYLQKLAPGPDGTIDEEKAIAVLHDCIKWNNHIIKNIPRMEEVKK